jgi:hypothetical protein
MSSCFQSTTTDAAFAHLRGIHALYMSWCFQDTITDAAFAHLVGIHTLNMRGCSCHITDSIFCHLAGVSELVMSEESEILEAAKERGLAVRSVPDDDEDDDVEYA